MKKLLLAALGAGMLFEANAEISSKIEVQGRECTIQTLQTRPIGPGATYYRYRVPEFPLNINMVRVDMRNPYVKIETSLPKDLSQGTELLTEAAKRYDSKNHHAITAQNSNFWIVSSQEMWNAYGASTHGVSLRNGMMSIDAKSYPFWWWWDTMSAGIVSVSPDNKIFIDLCRTEQTFTTAKLGKRDFASCNKGFRENEVGIYTPYFGPTRQFIPLEGSQKEVYNIDENSDCVEVLCTIGEGETWMGGRDIRFKVAEVRHSKGRGTIGSYDLALVSRDQELAKLEPGDDLMLNYSWTFDPDGQPVKPLVEQAVAGNMMVMRHGQITEQNSWDGYNTMVYSRAAYGVSEDGNTLYMMTIDKSNDQVYGNSVGCTTADMCDIVRSLGVWNLINVDAGGSAMLMVDGAIINRTTEGSPRQVGNGWMVFNTAPDDDTEIAALEFYDIDLQAPTNTLYSPRVIALNQYGTVLDNDFRDFTVTVDASLGTGAGNAFQASEQPDEGTITISTANGISRSRTIKIVNSTPSLVRDYVVLDAAHSYPIEVTTDFAGKTYSYNPAIVSWTSDKPEVAYVDADGVLRPVANGIATINGKLNEMDRNITVSVENAAEPTMSLIGEWTSWSPKSVTGIKDLTLGADGTLNYTYNSVRGRAWVSLNKDMTIYGCPEHVVLEFESSMPVNEVEIDLHIYGDDRGKTTYVPETEIAGGTPSRISFDISQLGDIADSRIYPLKMSTIKLYSPVGTQYKGTQYTKIKSLYAEYATGGDVDNIITDDRGILVSPNPVEASGTIRVSAPSPLINIEIYDMSGRLIRSAALSGNTASLEAPSLPGTYVVRAVSANTAATSLIIVR